LSGRQDAAGVSILVVNYHAAAYLERLVASIRMHLRDREVEILVHDNSGELSGGERLPRLAPGRLRVLGTGENIGYVAANNALCERAAHDLLVLMNPDTELIDDSLEGLLAYAECEPGLGAAGPMFLGTDRGYQVSCTRFPGLGTLALEHLLAWPRNAYAYGGPVDRPRACDVIPGACLVLRRSRLEGEPLFDRALVMFSEEVDLCRRLRRRGLVNAYYPAARVVHHGGGSSRGASVAPYVLFHYYRSKMLYLGKHWPRWAARLGRAVLWTGLLERALLLPCLGHAESGRTHRRVLRELWRARAEIAAAARP
jgi:GT2 family glycosyltransferase